MEYKASLDKTAKIVTLIITILFASIIIGQYFLITEGTRSIPIFTTVLLLVLYFGVFAFRVTGYSITTDKVIIHRPFDNIKIDKTDIKSVEALDKSKLSWSIRIFGVGGLFGYYGRFANSKIGRMTWYATRRDKPVLVVTNYDAKIILTPDDAERFVVDLGL